MRGKLCIFIICMLRPPSWPNPRHITSKRTAIAPTLGLFHSSSALETVAIFPTSQMPRNGRTLIRNCGLLTSRFGCRLSSDRPTEPTESFRVWTMMVRPPLAQNVCGVIFGEGGLKVQLSPMSSVVVYPRRPLVQKSRVRLFCQKSGLLVWLSE